MPQSLPLASTKKKPYIRLEYQAGLEVLVVGDVVMNKQRLKKIGQAKLRESLSKLDDEQQVQLIQWLSNPYNWGFNARDNQRIPTGPWSYWILKPGRGWGKNKTGANTVKTWALSGHNDYVNLIGATSEDVHRYMVNGPSGILAQCAPNEMPEYNQNRGILTWPNGCISLLFSAEKPERIRGPNAQKLWIDELCSWKYPKQCLENLDMIMRLKSRDGSGPQILITTTPKPIKPFKELLETPGAIIVDGTTFDNADNLDKSFLDKMTDKYSGTRFGRQELYGEVLDDNPGALWNRDMLDGTRISIQDKPKQFVRIVVGVDPPATAGGDECGIVVCGLTSDRRVYVLDDYSLQGSPETWGKQAILAYKKHQADRLVVEVNQGGDMVRTILRTLDSSVAIKEVRASKGKFARAEPVAALYEQGKVSHVGFYAILEDQMCEYDQETARKSPDRMDALVWAITELALTNKNTGVLDYMESQIIGHSDSETVEYDNPFLSAQLNALNKIFGRESDE